MLNLYAGVRADGSLLFISDAESGLQPDCRCPVCRSPLVAKKGSQKEWHFAHQPSQERPECKVGALNLLRHICREVVLSSPLLKIDSQHFALDGSTIVHRFDRPALSGSIICPRLDAAAYESFATLQCEHGMLGVSSPLIATNIPPVATVPGLVGEVRVLCPLPENYSRSLMSQSLATLYVKTHMRFDWFLYAWPARTESEVRDHLRRLRESEYATRFEAMRRRAAAARFIPLAKRVGLIHAASPQPRIDQMVAHRVADAVRQGRIKSTSNARFVYVKTADHSEWLLNMAAPTGAFLKPLGDRFPGWAGLFPQKLARPNLPNFCYDVLDVLGLVEYLATHATAFEPRLSHD